MVTGDDVPLSRRVALFAVSTSVVGLALVGLCVLLHYLPLSYDYNYVPLEEADAGRTSPFMMVNSIQSLSDKAIATYLGQGVEVNLWTVDSTNMYIRACLAGCTSVTANEYDDYLSPISLPPVSLPWYLGVMALPLVIPVLTAFVVLRRASAEWGEEGVHTPLSPTPKGLRGGSTV
ncbi:hypothetical protein KIPB_008379 [Kipferlia bialata]|uniref:Uncharacterized protein n=1 Tax=Kipferlia bialata TaxID=797122 RepID=A0A9K3CZX2_9EUKA|nr:hypothetical protein KIPB_008379 [Kipferlia bialata]|eukprot:g8379.t1